MEKSLYEKRKYTVRILLFTIIALVTFATTMRELSFGVSDFHAHMIYAINFRREFRKIITSPADFPHQILYPMWHILVNITYKISRLIFGEWLGPEYSAAFVTAIVNGFIYLLAEKILSHYKCKGSEIIAFGLSFVMPYVIPNWHDKVFYFGQNSPVIWHNPTNIIVKYFTLAGFFVIIRILQNIDDNKKNSKRTYFLLSAVILLSVMAKPAFFQGIVPALGVYILIHLIRTKFSKFRDYCLLCACFIPGFLIILFQYLFSFYFGEGGDGIGISWMEIAKVFYRNPWVHFLLALFFPICYILTNPKKSIKSTEIRLSVLYVICTWLEFCLLYEKGIRTYDGNFEWALCLAYAALWTSTSILFSKDWQEMDLQKTGVRVKNAILFILWEMHFVFGIKFLYTMFTAEKLYF